MNLSMSATDVDEILSTRKPIDSGLTKVLLQGLCNQRCVGESQVLQGLSVLIAQE